MFQRFQSQLAARFGVYEAVMLNYLWEELQNTIGTPDFHRRGQYWIRCSVRGFTAALPYLSEYRVKAVLRRLIERGLLQRGEFNEYPFDRTAWYSFTPYGLKIMTESEEMNHAE